MGISNSKSRNAVARSRFVRMYWVLMEEEHSDGVSFVAMVTHAAVVTPRESRATGYGGLIDLD